MIRSFVAIDFPGDVQDKIAALQTGLPVGRAVPPKNLHLTLAFLGDQNEAALSRLHEELERVRTGSFHATLAGLDLFGGRRPLVLAALAERAPQLVELHRRVQSALRTAGLTPEARRFRPHATIARLPRDLSGSGRARLQEFMIEKAGFAPIDVPVRGFSLYRSTLSREGATHAIMATYPLNGG